MRFAGIFLIAGGVALILWSWRDEKGELPSTAAGRGESGFDEESGAAGEGVGGGGGGSW